MFGYDDAKLERIRTGRKNRWWVIALELLIAAPILAYTTILWLWTTPGNVQWVLDQVVGEAPLEVRFAEVNLLPHGERLDPASWRLLFTGVTLRFDDPTLPEIDIDKVVVGVPELGRAWFGSELAFRKLIVVGLDIRAKKQRPADPWEPGKSALALVRADVANIWGARFWAPFDDPLPETEVHQIFGTLTNLSFTPGNRELAGEGHLRAARFRTGTLALDNVVFTSIKADKSDISLGGGSYSYAGGHGTISGQIHDVHRRPTVEMRVQLVDADAATLITASTGKPSPLAGRLDAILDVHSGGTLPRGGAWYEGQVVFQDGRVALGRALSPFQRDLFALAPWVDLDAADQVILGDVAGRMRFTRSGVLIHELSYAAGRRDLTLWGELTTTAVKLTLRAIPLKKAETRAGWGVVVEGPHGALTLRLATREELLRTGERDDAPAPDPNTLRGAIRAAVAGTFLDRPIQLRLPNFLRRRAKTADTTEPVEAPADASMDAPLQAPQDAPLDAPPEAPPDAPQDAPAGDVERRRRLGIGSPR